MIRRTLATCSGLLLGIVVAIAASSFTGMDGFSGQTLHVALGYICSGIIGASLGILHTRTKRIEYATSAGALALLGMFVLRSLPLGWLDLIALDGTAGPAGELPLVTLPIVGLMMGWVVGGIGPARDEQAH